MATQGNMSTAPVVSDEQVKNLLSELIRQKKTEEERQKSDLSESMNELQEAATSFIQLLDSKKPRMDYILKELIEISERMKARQKKTKIIRRIGFVSGAAGAVALYAAPMTGGLSVVAAAFCEAAVISGVTAFVGANIVKKWSENKKAENVKNVGSEFMEIVEQLSEKLKEIVQICKKLEETSTKVQTGKTLREVEEFQFILSKVKELKEKSGNILSEFSTILNMIPGLVTLLNIILSALEEDERLGDSIIKSADHIQKVFNEFTEMKEKLREFKEE